MMGGVHDAASSKTRVSDAAGITFAFLIHP